MALCGRISLKSTRCAVFIVKRRVICRFGHVLHLMHERWKGSISLTSHLGCIFTIIKWFLSPLLFLHLLFAFCYRSPKP
jgi:hypothetical protein